MDPLFPGAPAPLPPPAGITWTVLVRDGSTREPPRVTHAAGYEPFVALAGRYGTDAHALKDLWTFAHFVRAHRERLETDEELLRAAVVFLGNTLIERDPDCSWTNGALGLAVRSGPGEPVEVTPGRRAAREGRSLGVEGTVPALLAADEDRFLEFRSVVEHWESDDGTDPRGGVPVKRT